MHMISEKDLNFAELETLTTSRCATTIITANGEVQTHEEATIYVKELDIFLTLEVLKIRQQVCRKESFSMNLDTHMNGSTVKTTSHSKRYSDTVQHREIRSDRGSCFINEFFLKIALFNITDTSKAGN